LDYVYENLGTPLIRWRARLASAS